MALPNSGATNHPDPERPELGSFVAAVRRTVRSASFSRPRVCVARSRREDWVRSAKFRVSPRLESTGLRKSVVEDQPQWREADSPASYDQRVAARFFMNLGIKDYVARVPREGIALPNPTLRRVLHAPVHRSISRIFATRGRACRATGSHPVHQVPQRIIARIPPSGWGLDFGSGCWMIGPTQAQAALPLLGRAYRGRGVSFIPSARGAPGISSGDFARPSPSGESVSPSFALDVRLAAVRIPAEPRRGPRARDRSASMIAPRSSIRPSPVS